MSRVYVACKFRPTDARAFTYHYDGEEPLEVGDTVKVPDRSGDGWKRVEVASITHEEPPFSTKGIIVSIDDVDSDEGTPAREYIKNERLFVKVSPSRIRRLDEPDRPICNWCQKAPGPDDACQERSTDTWWHMVGNCPPGCITAARA